MQFILSEEEYKKLISRDKVEAALVTMAKDLHKVCGNDDPYYNMRGEGMQMKVQNIIKETLSKI